MTDDEGGPLPLRYLRDPRELRALAHPLRLRILEELFLDSPLTATQLSERVDESPANCSWHLRQLARHGYVAEAGGGAGRQRPWRAVLEQRSWGNTEDGAPVPAAEATTQLLYQREVDEYQNYQSRRAAEPTEWYDAAFWNQSLAWLTADELRELGAEITALVLRHSDRFADRAARPAGARPIRFVAWGFPARPWSDDADDGPVDDAATGTHADRADRRADADANGDRRAEPPEGAE